MLKQGQTISAVPGSYIILLDPIPGMTEGGLHLPKGSQRSEPGEINQVAMIVAVGDSYVDQNGNDVYASFGLGDYVLVNPNAMMPLQHKSMRLHVTSFTHVIAGVVPEDFVKSIGSNPNHYYTIGDI